MNRSLIERAMQRMADQEATRAKPAPSRRPTDARKEAVPTLTTLSRDEVAQRQAARAAAARSVIEQAAGRPTAEPPRPRSAPAEQPSAAPERAAASTSTTTSRSSSAETSRSERAVDAGPSSRRLRDLESELRAESRAQSRTEPRVDARSESRRERSTSSVRAARTPEHATAAAAAAAADAATRTSSARIVKPARVSVPIAAMTRRGFLNPDDKSSTVHQEFRLIKRRLLDNAFGKLRPGTENGRRIMVTSALPAEGKTFCAINLAISIAIGGEHPVILVDADIARPTIARQLDLEDHAGLADALADSRVDPRSLVLPTDLPGLSLFLAGAHRDQPVDLLASESMTSLLDRLSALYPDHVFVIDTPPLLAVTECRTLAANAGQVLLVVAAGETPRAAVQEALSQLEVCDIVGTVLNKSPARPKAPAYYGY